MRLILPSVNIEPEEGFTKNDLFGYSAFGENMMNVVAANPSELVMLLDGSWGTGKSVFATQWAGLLRQNDFPVIEFDAFRNDYQEDAFLAFAGEVYELGKEKLSAEQAPVIGFLDKAIKTFVVLAPVLAKASVRAVIARFINTEGMGEAVKASIDAISDDGGEAVEKIISKQLENRNSERGALDSFSTSLSEIATALSGGREDRPLVIIVDELDRCKPTFALNILERIKHLFSTENVVFVLVADFAQLQSVVKGIYGAGDFDSIKYLEKFFHVRATLPTIENLTPESYAAYIWDKMEIKADDPDLVRDCLPILEAASRANPLSLRTIERVSANFVLAFQSSPQMKPARSPIILGLCLLRHLKPEVFDDALSGTLEPEDLFEAVKCHKWRLDIGEPFKKAWTKIYNSPDGWYAGSEYVNADTVCCLARKITNFHIEPVEAD